MDPFPFTDMAGRVWNVYDYRVVRDWWRVLPINDDRAERRAFVPVAGGTVLIYEFPPVSYHSTEPKLVQDQLRIAKPISRGSARSSHPTGHYLRTSKGRGDRRWFDGTPPTIQCLTKGARRAFQRIGDDQ